MRDVDAQRVIVERLLDHIERGTTDLADDVLAVPADAYSSPEHFERERERLFRRLPLLVALSCELPDVGSYVATEVAAVPMLLVRGTDGAVRAFLNACRHRGVRVVDDGGRARRFTCPFHAWVYDTQGCLVGIPDAGNFGSVDREANGLVPLPVGEKHGLVFARATPGPPIDVDAHLGEELASELAQHELERYHPFSGRHVHRVQANWKVTLDTFRENYHFDYLHRNTISSFGYGGVLTFDSYGPHLRNCSALRSIDGLRSVPEHEWRPFDHFVYQYAIFPNVSLTVVGERVELFQILPGGSVGESIALHAGFSESEPRDEGARAELAEQMRYVCETVVQNEDFWVAERTTAGLGTGILPSVLFGRNEPAPQHLHRAFARVLRGEPPDAEGRELTGAAR